MIEQPSNILVIKSIQSELIKVEAFIKDVFNYYKFPNTCYNKVFLCISEAITNCIEHGNKGDHRKKVELNVDCKKHLIAVTITDQGDGFDYKSLPDPTQKQNLLKESGRGIHIIKSFSRTFSFNEKGNSIHFQIECK